MSAAAGAANSHRAFNMDSLLGPASGTSARTRLIAVAALLATVTNAVLFMLPPLLPLMKDQFHVSLAGETWIYTALTLGGGAGYVMIPRLADILSDRTAGLLSGAILTFGALIAGVGNTYLAIVVGSLLLGFASAAQLLPIGFLRRHLPGGGVSTAVSILIMATGAGVVAGMLGGGVTVSSLSIRAFFFLTAIVFAVTTLAIAMIVPPDKPESSPRLEGAATAWMIAWVAALLLALSQGLVWGDGALIPLLIGIVAGRAWWKRQQRAETTVFDMQLLKMPAVKVACLSAGLFGAIDAGFVLLTTYYTQTPRVDGYGIHLSPLGTGWLMLPFALTMFISGKAAEKRVQKGHPNEVLVVGAAISALGIGFLTVAHTQPWEYLLGAALVGLGSRAGYSGAFAVPQMFVEQHKAGMAAGMVGTVMAVGIAFGSALISATLASDTIPGTSNDPKAYLYTWGYVLTLMFAVAVVIAAYASYRRNHGAFKALLRQTGVIDES